MSLSKDKELIKQLIRIAQDATTPAPTAPALTSITPDARALALKLIQNLQQEAAKPESAFTSDKGDLSIRDPKILRNLDNLLLYLNSNVVMTNEHSLVVPPNAQGKLNPDLVKYNIYSPYPKADNGEAPKYFVYKDGLLSFIRTLQAQATSSKNVLLGNLLNNLIEQVNSDFTEMTAVEAEKPKTYPNNMQLDLLKPIISPNDQALGDIMLTPPDLASKQALFQFIKNKDLKYVQNGKEISVSENMPVVFNGILKFMKTRAAAWSKITDEGKAYLDLISKLDSSAESNTDNTKPTQKQLDMAGAGFPRPLFPDKIDIDLSEKFIDWYIDFCNAGTDPNAASTAHSYQSYKEKIAEFRNRYPGIIVQLLGTEGITQIQNNIRIKSSGRETSVDAYVELLKEIIGGVVSAIGQLESVFQALNAPIFKKWLTYIEEQKNNYSTNLNHIQRFEQALESNFNNQKAKNGK